MTSPGTETARKGWNPDPPSFLDFKFGDHFPTAAPLQSIDLRPLQSPVRDQGQIGSCTGFATAAAIEYLRRTDADEFSTIYSPLFLYYEARREEGTIDVDCGAYIRTLMDITRKVGAAPEGTWKYREKRFKSPPSRTAYKQAPRWKLGGHYRCDGLDQTLAALSQHKPIVGGFMCHTGMDDVNVHGSGMIPVPDRSKGHRPTGGHAVAFVGFDAPSRVVFFKNSWSKEWGKEGFGFLPFEYLQSRDLSGDFWALVSEAA